MWQTLAAHFIVLIGAIVIAEVMLKVVPRE